MLMNEFLEKEPFEVLPSTQILLKCLRPQQTTKNDWIKFSALPILFVLEVFAITVHIKWFHATPRTIHWYQWIVVITVIAILLQAAYVIAGELRFLLRSSDIFASQFDQQLQLEQNLVRLLAQISENSLQDLRERIKLEIQILEKSAILTLLIPAATFFVNNLNPLPNWLLPLHPKWMVISFISGILLGTLISVSKVRILRRLSFVLGQARAKALAVQEFQR